MSLTSSKVHLNSKLHNGAILTSLAAFFRVCHDTCVAFSYSEYPQVAVFTHYCLPNFPNVCYESYIHPRLQTIFHIRKLEKFTIWSPLDIPYLSLTQDSTCFKLNGLCLFSQFREFHSLNSANAGFTTKSSPCLFLKKANSSRLSFELNNDKLIQQT